MDNQGKQTLLRTVIEHAIIFQKHKRARLLSSRDIEDAIHLLGFRPLLPSLDANGNEAINPNDLIVEPLNGANHIGLDLSVVVPVDATWVPSTDIFRKRKRDTQQKILDLKLSHRGKIVLDKIIECCHTGSPLPSGVSDNEIVMGAWMLGLHFSDLITSRSSYVDWRFVRNSILFLHTALRVIRQDEGIHVLVSPWKSGLEAIAKQRALLTLESEEQEKRIRKISLEQLDFLF